NALIKKHNLKKSETIMIGNDYLSDINGSRNVGISSLYIHQSISPDIKGKLNSDFSVMDGDVTKIKKLIVK
ncbi:MAG: HAD hydrolase-like protein, partial [Acutalibacteraceae bacterium]